MAISMCFTIRIVSGIFKIRNDFEGFEKALLQMSSSSLSGISSLACGVWVVRYVPPPAPLLPAAAGRCRLLPAVAGYGGGVGGLNKGAWVGISHNYTWPRILLVKPPHPVGAPPSRAYVPLAETQVRHEAQVHPRMHPQGTWCLLFCKSEILATATRSAAPNAPPASGENSCNGRTLVHERHRCRRAALHLQRNAKTNPRSAYPGPCAGLRKPWDLPSRVSMPLASLCIATADPTPCLHCDVAVHGLVHHGSSKAAVAPWQLLVSLQYVDQFENTLIVDTIVAKHDLTVDARIGPSQTQAPTLVDGKTLKAFEAIGGMDAPSGTWFAPRGHLGGRPRIHPP